MRRLGAAVAFAGLLLLSACGTAGGAIDAKALLGLDRGAVAEKIGQPNRVRREADAEIWQYSLKTCVLDLFLYPQNGQQEVLHVEARTLDGRTTDPSTCRRGVS